MNIVETATAKSVRGACSICSGEPGVSAMTIVAHSATSAVCHNPITV